MAEDGEPKTLRELARGLRKRGLVTAKLAGRVGLRAAKRQLFGGRGDDAEQDDGEREHDVRAAEKLVDELGSLKGLMMKFGQIASYMPGAMPPAAQRVLAKLQAHTVAMHWDTVRGVIEAELGMPPGEAFSSIEPTPFAAASIGQVHRARTGGRDVAVKIQYPGIEGVLAEDLRSAGLFARMSTLGMSIDGKELVEELRVRALEECDYRAEARAQEAFRALFSAAMPGAHVPAVVAERSARRVLTSVLDPGQGFYAFAESAPQHARDRAALVIFGTCFRCIFEHCVYNADPHPGNYLFAPDGDVTFLDFGCVRRFDPDMIATWKRVAKSVLDGDAAEFRRRYPELGFVPRPDKFDWDHQWRMMQYLYRPFLCDGPFRYTHEYVRESYGLMLFDNPNRFRTAMPGQWLFLNRLQWGLNSIMAHLGAEARFCDIWRQAVESQIDPLEIQAG